MLVPVTIDMNIELHDGYWHYNNNLYKLNWVGIGSVGFFQIYWYDWHNKKFYESSANEIFIKRYCKPISKEEVFLMLL